MGKYENDVQRLLTLVGGKENIQAVSHCMTRMRFVLVDAKKADAKGKRWNAVSESAAKQSKRSLIPEVAPLMTYKEAVKEAAGYDMVLLPYESADGIRKTRELLASVKPGTDIAVFIGPEGGFEDEEVELARENRAEIVTLGKRILRTETAGLCMLSALMLQLEV